MDKQTLEYIRNRAQESETGSIKAVSCPDIRALLDERAALLEAIKELLADVEFAQPQIEAGLIGNRQIKAARATIQKAEE